MSDILVLTGEQKTANLVGEVLDLNASWSDNETCSELADLKDLLQGSPDAVVLVDVDPDPYRALDDLEALIDRFPRARFVALCAEPRSDLYPLAMQAGIRHIQVKREIPSHLAKILRRLNPHARASSGSRGTVVVVLQASGGCGATTIAVNLAHELQVASASRVLLVDLDYCFGTVSTYLDLSGKYGVGEVLTHKGEVDANLIETTAVRYSDQYHVLMSPVSVDSSKFEPPRSDNLDAFLFACRQGYGFTVIDAPRVSMDVAALLAAEASHTLIVFQPLLKDIRVAKTIRADLNEHGSTMDRVRLVMNRAAKKRQMIRLKEAREAFGGIDIDCLRNDYGSALRAANYGKPLAEVAVRSPLRRDLARLAGEMCGASRKKKK